MRARAYVWIDLKSKPNVFLKALEPETKTPVTPRAKTKLSVKGRKLLLEFKASDTTALRASMSAYIRWLVTIEEIVSMLKALERHS